MTAPTEQDAAKIAAPRVGVGHAWQCDWHCDQYDHECTCGAARPATLSWAQAEVVAAADHVVNAQNALSAARLRLRKMERAQLRKDRDGED